MKYLIASIIITSLMSGMMVTEVIAPEPLQSEIKVVYAEVIPEVALEVEKPLEVIVEPVEVTEIYTVTAYCSCSKCCGEWATKRNGGPVVGAYGVEITPNYSVAAPLPYGTKLKIDGKTYEVQDTTASWIVDRYAGRIIDIYMGDSHEEALKWGKVELEVTIFE